MRKIRIVFFSATTIIFVLTSCNKSPKENLIVGCEKFIKREFLIKLKDPKSYEKITTDISDTTLKRDALKEVMDLFYSESSIKSKSKLIKDYKEMDQEYGSSSDKEIRGLEEEVSSITKSRDSMKILINAVMPNEIGYVSLVHTYRAKNGFGALDVGRLVIHCYPNERDEDKKFFIYSNE